ncbi:MAG: zinc-dependent metalloprotease [Bacteroidaceae bacterium]
MKRLLLIALLSTILIVPIQAENKTSSTKAEATVSKKVPPLKKGLFFVERKEKDWFLEIPDSIVGRLILSVTRYTATPTQTGIYGGEMNSQQTVYWEKASGNRLLLRSKLLYSKADSTDNINKAVSISNEDPIIGAFKIEKCDSNRYRINVTNFFIDDNTFSLRNNIKSRYGISHQKNDVSFIDTIKTFPINTEIRTIRTYASNGYSTPAAYTTGNITFGLNTSFVLLPKEPMLARIFDQRVGYFADSYDVFSDDQQQVSSKTFITRWRLEPKSEDREKMKKGELVEPQKPIVFYIDPATPKQWKKYLIQGVNDWQVAFEKAGFKNAIMAKEWPENDSTMSMEDARYSVIRYLASNISNAYGPQVHDPRSGEIIESHIGWYHNVMDLLHRWYMIQAGTLDPRARTMKYDEALMGELIRFVSSHEVGHTLGLRHNFGASSLSPVDSLRNKQWVEKYGHTASIMDYARFNYVAQPEDNISTAGIFPRINDYDLWAIEWGYRPTWNSTDSESDRYEMDLLTKERTKNKPRLWFGDGETNPFSDPRCQTEDLGDNSMKASNYGILNLKRIIRVLPQWTYWGNDINGDNLKKAYSGVVGQFQRYIGHVIQNIGGTFTNYKTIDEPGSIYTPESKAQQKDALSWLNTQVFNEPSWIINVPYINRITPKQQDITTRIGETTVDRLSDASFICKLVETYKASEYLSDLTKMLFKETQSNTKVSTYRRSLQRRYTLNLVELYKNYPPIIDERAAVLSMLKKILLTSKVSATKMRDEASKVHFSEIADYIEKALNDPSKK